MNRKYIQQLITENKRLDNRKPDEYRKPITIDYNISKNAEGSARVTMGKTIVVAGVKLGLGEPYPDTPDEGAIIVNVELLPMSSPEFESGPPGSQAVELARVVDRGIRESQTIDFKKLCVRQGELVWIVYIDIYTFNDDGNLIDAAALASLAALSQAKFPKVENEKVVFGELSNKKLPITKKPITITLYKINGKTIVDPTLEEEDASDARFSVTIEGEIIYAVQKGGIESFTEKEILEMLELAIEKSKEISKHLK